MISSLSASDERFLAAMAQLSKRVEDAQNQITSGHKIAKVSDEPDSISAVLSAQAQIEQTAQIGKNLVQFKTETDTAEQSISTAITILDQLNKIAAQGVSETMPAAQRTTLGEQVGALLDQLVSIANTVVEGRYIFSGDTDQVAAYAIEPQTALPDGTIPDPLVSTFGGSPSTRKAMHPNGTTFDVAKTAEQIFDDPSASVFEAVINLRDALKHAPTSPEGGPAYSGEYETQTQEISDALAALKTSREHVSQELAFYGVVQNRISEATDFASRLENSQRQQLSAVQDADLVASILELSQAMNARDAALNARAKIQNTSLFDFLR